MSDITSQINEIIKSLGPYLPYARCKSAEKAYRIMLKKYPDVLDMKQMCEILGISLKTGYGLIQENKIECLKVGRAYRIPKPFLLSYLRIGVSNE